MSKLTIIRGDDVTIPITFTQANGDAVNLTNCTVFFTAKRDPKDEDVDAAISKTITVHSSPTEGETTIVLTHTDTAIASGIYKWDLQIKDSGNLVSSTIQGELEVKQDITQRTS